MRGDDGNYVSLVIFTNFGSDVQSWQPPKYPRPQLAGGIMRGDEGIEAQFFAILQRWEMAPQTYFRRRYRMPEFGDQGTQAPLPKPAWGWIPETSNQPTRRHLGIFQTTSLVEVLPPLISAAAWAFDPTEILRYRRPLPATEIEPSFVPLPRYVPFGYDHQESLVGPRRRPVISVDEPFVPVLPILRWGFEQPIPALRAYRPRPPIDAVSPLIITPPHPVWGFEVQPPQLRPRPHRPLDRGYELISSFPAYWHTGWEIQPWQPPHRRPERGGGLMRGVDGVEFPLILEHFDGWEPVLFWPPHPRPERNAGWMTGDFGAYAPLIYLVPSGAIAFDYAVWLATAYDIGQAP
jgi:hypothetical protein